MTTTRVDPTFRAGELLLVDLDPTLGTEQRGRRPALVVSQDEMLMMAQRVIVCPITRNRNPWPTKVFLPPGLAASGAILVDQVRSIDREARVKHALGFVPDPVLAEVRGKLAALFGMRLV